MLDQRCSKSPTCNENSKREIPPGFDLPWPNKHYMPPIFEVVLVELRHTKIYAQIMVREECIRTSQPAVVSQAFVVMRLGLRMDCGSESFSFSWLQASIYDLLSG